MNWQAIGVILGIITPVITVFLVIIWFSIKKWINNVSSKIDLLEKELNDLKVMIAEKYVTKIDNDEKHKELREDIRNVENILPIKPEWIASEKGRKVHCDYNFEGIEIRYTIVKVAGGE